MNITEETKCRICRGELKVVLDLGRIYPSSFLKDDEKVSEDMKVPLVLAECEDCKLIQLKHTVDLDTMYRQYWYMSSLNKSMVSSLNRIVEDIERRIPVDDRDIVLDIGCNDGTMLNLYTNQVRKIGFDPALNTSTSTNIELTRDYFTAKAYNSIPNIEKAKVVTAIAMFYDLPDPHQFVEDVVEVLDEKGIFVVQFTDLMSMIKVTAFDNICAEHLEYYKLSDVTNLLEAHGLTVIDVSYNNVNGGSVRITAAHEGAYPVSGAVTTALVDEFNYLSTHDMEYFRKNIETVKFKIREFLKWAEFHHHKVYLLGASTKGNTLLQICEITVEQVPFAADVNKEKFGLRTVGSNIKIISEDEALIKHPNYFIVPVWHFRDNLLANPKIQDYMKSGGRLVFPMPEFTVVIANEYETKGFKI